MKQEHEKQSGKMEVMWNISGEDKGETWSGEGRGCVAEEKSFLTQQYRLFSNYSASFQMDIQYVILIIHEL